VGLVPTSYRWIPPDTGEAASDLPGGLVFDKCAASGITRIGRIARQPRIKGTVTPIGLFTFSIRAEKFSRFTQLEMPMVT